MISNFDKTRESKDLWVDLLCMSSWIKVWFLSTTINFDRIYYINKTKFIFSFFIKLLERLTGKPIRQVDFIVEANEKLDGVSLYEHIQQDLKFILDDWLHQEINKRRVSEFCQQNQFNPLLFKWHLKQAAYLHIFRAVELKVLAGKFSKLENSLFVLKKGPFQHLFKQYIKSDQIYFYRAWFLFSQSIQNRKDYFYDKFANKYYFMSRFSAVGSIMLFFCYSIVNACLCKIFGIKAAVSRSHDANIVIDLINPRQLQHSINDVFWLKDSGIDPQTVWGIEHEMYDNETIDYLRKIGIRRCKILRHPLSFFYSLRNKYNRDLKYFSMPFSDCVKSIRPLIGLWVALFSWGESGWIKYMQTIYEMKTTFWVSIYKQLNARLLFSMYDIDEEKLVRAEAMAQVKGLFLGSHWSNHPISRIDIEKCYDVFFMWGPYFEKHIFNEFPYKAVFHTGFILDYYFENRRRSAENILNQYPNKFIISYHDNIVAHDLSNSQQAQILLYRMFISLLETYAHVIIFIKPKRITIFEKMLTEMPELKRYIDEKRMIVFPGETKRTKAVPAEIGMASHLVVGLGINTAATECYFAGSFVYYAEFTGFKSNAFGQKGLNRFVFEDSKILEQNIIDRIEQKSKMTFEDQSAYYASLDPYRDGQAYRRIGSVIKVLQEFLSNGVNREAAIVRAKERFAPLCQEQYWESSIKFLNVAVNKA